MVLGSDIKVLGFGAESPWLCKNLIMPPSQHPSEASALSAALSGRWGKWVVRVLLLVLRLLLRLAVHHHLVVVALAAAATGPLAP